MHSATFTRAIALSCLIALSSPGAQDTTQSLGDLARKERERKKALTQTNDQIQNLKLSPEEDKAYLMMGFVVLTERTCKASLGRYAEWEQLFAGCRAQGVGFAIERKDDPRRDPDYDYRLSVSGDAFELSVAPRRSGLGGFFTDGQKIYFNPQGAATRQSKIIYDFASAAAAGTAGHSKKVYTEDDLQRGGQTNAGGGGTSLPEASGGTSSSAETAPAQGEYKPEEERALKYMCGFSLLETLNCQLDLKRLCSVDELAEGVQLGPGKVFGFEKGYDPRRDPNYEYLVIAHGDNFEVHAVPRKPGLGGFFDDTRGPIRYNPKGEASVQDKRVKGSVNCPAVIRFPVRQIEVE